MVLEGPRACGKTAVGEILFAGGHIETRVDLSDATTLAAAKASPSTFIESLPTPAFIDEAQLLPELTLAVKHRVDQDRKRGAFVLTGSSRLGRTQLGGSDPLAGRAVRLRLHGMTQAELSGKPCNLVEQLFTAPELGKAKKSASINRADLLQRIARGGLPNFAGMQAPVEPSLQALLAQEYVEGVLFHEIGGRHDRAELLRLYRYLAASTARIANVSAISSELGMSRIAINQRLASLEASFLLNVIAGHRSSEHRTLTAHPKIHASDSGLAAWAARLKSSDVPAALIGALVETFVVNELIAQSSWVYSTDSVRHWRDTARKLEVDAIVTNLAGEIIAFEVKAGADVRPDDLKGLRVFLSETKQATKGIVFYTGSLVHKLDEKIWAVPITALWAGLQDATSPE